MVGYVRTTPSEALTKLNRKLNPNLESLEPSPSLHIDRDMPVEGTADSGDVHGLLRELNAVHHIALTLYERDLPHDLTMAQFMLLQHLASSEAQHYGSWSPQRLARTFSVTKATMSSTLRRAAEKGFIKIKTNEDDRRGKHVALTEAGRQAIEDVNQSLLPSLQAIARGIDQTTVAEIMPLLARLRTVLARKKQSIDEAIA